MITPGPDGSKPLSYPILVQPVLGRHCVRHHEVALSAEDMDRLIPWMDANALFYGTFKPEDQARQLKGERIEGPELN